MSKDDEIAQL